MGLVFTTYCASAGGGGGSCGGGNGDGCGGGVAKRDPIPPFSFVAFINVHLSTNLRLFYANLPSNSFQTTNYPHLHCQTQKDWT
jgi:hypothetical protein